MKLHSPLECLPKPDPATQARLEAWYRRIEARHRASWPALRRVLLTAAQRAQDVRNRVIG